MPKVVDTAENAAKCVCGRCPTFVQSDCPEEKTEALYCARQKTACELQEMGCICGVCPVHSENQLTSEYFCTKGAAE
jgi:hypothetical protein